MSSIGRIDICVIAAYYIVFIIIGILAGKKVKTSKDFNSAGQQMPLSVMVGTTIATAMSTTVVFTNYDRIHSFSSSGILWILSYYAGWALMIIITKKLRESECTGIPGFLELKFGKTSKKIASIFTIVGCLASLSAIIMAVGTTASTLGICNRTTGIFIGAALMVLFTVFSGLWGVALTDSIQSLILVCGLGLILPIIAFSVAGGFGEIVATIPAEKFDFDITNPIHNIAPGMLLSYMVTNVFSAGSDPTFAQRAFAAKDSKTAVKGMIIACVVTTVVVILACAPALTIPTLYPDMEVGSEFVPRFIADYFPPVVKGLMLAAVLGLLLTTGDSLLMLLSAAIVDDFIKPNKPEMTDKQAINLTRLFVCCAPVVMIIGAFYFKTLSDAFAFGASALVCATFFPLYFGCYWDKLNSKAVAVAMIAGGCTSILWDMFLTSATGIRGVFMGLAINLLIMLVGTAILGKKKEEVKEV